jgi:hypothetical protein
VNMLIGLVWLAVAWFSTGDWVAADIAVAVTAAICIWPRQFCAYVVPVLGVVTAWGVLVNAMFLWQGQGPWWKGCSSSRGLHWTRSQWPRRRP